MNTKTTWLDYGYIFLLLIYAGSATVFARSLGNISTFGSWVAIFATAFIVYYRRIRIYKQFYHVTGIFLLYAAVTTINNGLINLMWITQILLYLTIAYVVVQLYGLKFFEIYEKAIYWLCICSLVFWAVELIAPSLVLRIVSILSFSDVYAQGGNVAANMGIYTVGNREFASDYQLLLRNAGFAWEPGAFSVMICLAVFCNAIRTNFAVRKNSRLYVLLFTLLTTQSTTGMILLLILMAGYVISQRKSVAILTSLCAVPLMYLIFSAPYVQDKMVAEYTNMDIETRIQRISEANGEVGALGRMESLLIEWDEFMRHPLIGLGGWDDGAYLQQMGVDVATVSGIGKLLSKYGLFMSLLFFLALIKTTKFVRDTFHCRGAIIFPLLFVGLMISYNLWLQPVVMPFWIFYYFKNKPQKSFVRHSLRINSV